MRSGVQRRGWAVLGLAAASVGMPAGSVEWTQSPPQPRPRGTTQVRTVVLHPATEDAFDWLDAGIGGAVGLGLALVAAGGSMVLPRRPQRPVPLDQSTPRKEQHR